MNSIVNEIRLFFFLNKLMFKQHLNLVWDWWLAIIGMIIEQTTSILFLWVIFSKIDVIKGWTFHEMIFLHALYVLSKPVYRLFFQGVENIHKLVLNGGLDQILIRPRNPLILIMTSRTNPVAIGDLLLGTVLLLYSTSHIDVDWSIWRIFYLFILVFCTSFVYVGAHLLKGSISIFVIKIEAINALLQQFRDYAKYPISIYHPFIKIILITLLPYGLVSSVPAEIFLGKEGIIWIAWLAPLFCILYMAMTVVLFQWSLKYYSSCGS